MTDTVTAAVWVWNGPNITDEVFIGIATDDPGSAVTNEVGYGLDFYEITEDATGNVAVIGDPDDQAETVALLTASYAEYYPSGIISPAQSIGDLEELYEAFEKAGYSPVIPEYRRDSPSARLVVVEEKSFELEQRDRSVAAFTAALHPILAEGWGVGWGVLCSAEYYRPILRPGGPQYLPQRVFALGRLTWDREAGLPVRELIRAVTGGVSTAQGLREVVAGAPVDWVAAYETSAVEVSS